MAAIALVTGICVRHDAISNVVRLQEKLLVEAGHDVRVYSHHTDYPSARHLTVTDAWTLVREPWFRSADLVIFHFGMRYGMFDALNLQHPTAIQVVEFHNVTSPALLPEPARTEAFAARDQISIASLADVVWSDSDYNTRCLLEWSDVDPARIRPMPLSVPWTDTARAEPLVLSPQAEETRRNRIISVGRLLAAKGQLDLVEAVARLPEPLRSSVDVAFVGSAEHSDDTYIAAMRSRIADLALDGSISILLDLFDDELRERYRSAGVLVSTSRHEGFCVPVLEGLSMGCRVVVTDAGALPDTAGPTARVVPVGDLDELAGALEDELGAPRPPDRQWREAVSSHLSKFTLSAFRDRLLDGVDDALALRG